MLTLSSQQIKAANNPPRYFFGRYLDFILLGGGSFALLALARLAFSRQLEGASSVAIALAVIINHPHFAHSYQLFYGSLPSRLLSKDPKLVLPAILSGFFVPAGLIVFFYIALHRGSSAMISLAASIMYLTVGWHYVKQGYGILITDSILKRCHFSATSKNILLFNCYSTWIFSWLLINSQLSSFGNLFGIEYFHPAIPIEILKASGLVCIASSAVFLLMIISAANKNPGSIPWNGISAYAVGLYPWLLWRDPFMILFYPLLHSLQYLTIVWRMKINQAAVSKSAIRPSLRLSLFACIGIALGQIGFYTAPQALANLFPHFQLQFNGAVFMFTFWTFINIHHYFIDSTIWRKENRSTMMHLFSHATSST